MIRPPVFRILLRRRQFILSKIAQFPAFISHLSRPSPLLTNADTVLFSRFPARQPPNNFLSGVSLPTLLSDRFQPYGFHSALPCSAVFSFVNYAISPPFRLFRLSAKRKKQTHRNIRPTSLRSLSSSRLPPFRTKSVQPPIQENTVLCLKLCLS